MEDGGSKAAARVARRRAHRVPGRVRPSTGRGSPRCCATSPSPSRCAERTWCKCEGRHMSRVIKTFRKSHSSCYLTNTHLSCTLGTKGDGCEGGKLTCRSLSVHPFL